MVPPPRVVTDAVRPGFDDTALSRGGLGANPWGEPLQSVGTRRD